MPAKGQSAKEKRKAQKLSELAMKESMEACAEGEAILEKINVDKGVGLGQFPKAIVQFSKAVEGNSQNAIAYTLRAKCMKLTGEFAKAISDYSKALELNPSDLEALTGRAYCAMQTHAWDDAISDYSIILEAHPDDDYALNMRGYARVSKRPTGLSLRNIEYKQILSDYSQAISYNDCNFHAYANRGNVQFDRGEFFNAIEDYSRALYIKDDYWYIHYRRGIAYYEFVYQELQPKDEEGAEVVELTGESGKKTLKEKWEEEFWQEEQLSRKQDQQQAFLTQALQDFTAYIKHEEKDKGEPSTSALVHRAHVYLLQKNFDEALKDFKKAKELDPNLEPLVNPQIDAIREQTGVKALVHAE